MQKQTNYQELATRFQVEELKQRLEFDMAEAAGWSKQTKVTATAGGSSASATNTTTGATTNTQTATASVSVSTDVGWGGKK